MSEGFTPGPWVVNPYRARVDCDTVSEIGGLLPVCEMLWPTDERSEAETFANVRLIAAAPDLFEALEKLLTVVEVVQAIRGPKGREICRGGLAALAKARGAS